MTPGNDALDRLVRGHRWTADWPDVLERAGMNRPARLVTKRHLVVAFAALAAVLLPLVAVGAENDWWFLKFGGPTPITAPSVVKEGVWDGHAWQMTAYPSTSDGLCVAITPTNSTSHGTGGAQECGPFAGIARTPETKTSPDLTITFLSGSLSRDLPAYIVGPVIGEAVTVEIRFGGGTVLRVPTFAGPESLNGTRFYATQLPASVHVQTEPETTGTFLEWVAGLDENGKVVACLAPRNTTDGVSPLSACR